jgi:2-amino-4-hydroxy-6-hydroxymethyldihydropteridine diphosphokinase
VLKLNAQNNILDNLVLIGLGSNIDPEKNLISALESLANKTCLADQANIWQTPAYGSDGPDYLNTAALVYTNLTLENFKITILSEIENELGRIRSTDKFSNRTIDLDILVFENQIVDDDLWLQPHITIPAAEILPDLLNPDSGESLAQAANRLLPGLNFIKRVDLI